MPFVNIKLIAGVFSDAEKKEMISKVTDAMAAVEGENLRELTIVVIEEVKSGHWGFGGKTLSASDVKKHRAVR